MTVDYAAILDAWLRAMTTRDVEGVMRICHPDIRHSVNLGDVPLPFVGVSTGLAACRRRTQQIFDSWLLHDTDLKITSIQGNEVRATLAVTLQHRWTGYCIDTSIRKHFRFEGGLIRSYDCYMDAPRFTAFMRYVGIAPSRAPSSMPKRSEG